jgi:hypothetical protein
MEYHTHEEVAQGLRELADWIEKNPESVLPSELVSGGSLKIFQVSGKDEMAAIARAFGTCEKEVDSDFFRLVKMFGPIRVEAIDYRENVCERIVTSSETIVEMVPDPEFEVPKIEQSRVLETVEWRCPGSLLVESQGVAK